MKKNNIKIWFKRNIVIIILLLLLVSLEIFSLNHDFYIYHFYGLNQNTYETADAQLFGFELSDGVLIAKHDDPTISFRNNEEMVRFLYFECSNTDPDAYSQIYYQTWRRPFNEVNSIIFTISAMGTSVTLPKTVKLSNLRIDLTNRENDELFCTEITINPKQTYNLSYLTISLLLLCILGLFFGDRFISEKTSNYVWSLLIANKIWMFIIFLVLIDITYPVTLAYDSGHYLWLANLIKQGNWSSWDPFRNIFFPLKIHFSTNLFGLKQDSLLIPMIIAHIIFFVFSCKLANKVLKPRYEKERFIINLIIFLLVALDPTIVGYYHILLTEYLVATIAIVSCLLAVEMYQETPFSRKFNSLSAFFLILITISWHIKQDYIGAALFPFLIATILIIIREQSRKVYVNRLIVIIGIIGIIFLSSFAWNAFLEGQGNPMKEERDLSLMVGTSLDNQVNLLEKGLISFINTQLFRYFQLINFWTQENHIVNYEFSLTHGFQNDVLAHRMYLEVNQLNQVFDTTAFDPYIEPYITKYVPVIWLNAFFEARLTLSHFFFTTSFLILPIAVPLLFFFWLHEKNLRYTSLLILSGTSLLNALLHMMTGLIDRYLFFGYPLNLLSLLFVLYLGFRFTFRKLWSRINKD